MKLIIVLLLLFIVSCSKKPAVQEVPFDPEEGAYLYVMYCARCHQPNGLGIPGTYPPVFDSDYLIADRERTIKILVYGQEGEIVVNGVKYEGTMKKPEFPDMTDEEIAIVLTYILSKYENPGPQVTVKEVAKVRKKYKED
jgi:mono/diheme cytochrome c family protein